MRVAQFDDVAEVAPVGAGFRGGSIRFKDLLQGEEGRPDNFALQWVTVDDAFHTPRHRHNFEQVRILIDGQFGFGSQQVQHAGTVGYFCEGTAYTQDAKGRSETLLLQVGGPSGAGFMSRRQLRQAVAELSGRGEFHDGIYTWWDDAGKKHHQDSYEACWEHVHARKIVYPTPQIQGPVLMEPSRFSWVALDQSGVSTRLIGRFNERGLEISQRRLAAGAVWQHNDPGQSWLLFIIEGQGEVHAQGSRAELKPKTSIHYEAGESMKCIASTEVTLWCLGLPMFQGVSHA
jgi:quercetin dioxygenase-like cupin family protein